MPATTLARFIVLEAWRGGLPWVAGTVLLVCAALAAFLSQVAITEGTQLRLAIVGAVLRAAAVFLMAAYVTSSTLREMNDKALELMMSLPLSRATQYLGRLLGFSLCGAALAAVFTLPLFVWADPFAALTWGVSLTVEAALVAAIALFFAMTLSQLISAIGATLGLYLLARSIPAVQAIAAGPLAEPSFAQQAARWSVDGVALLLPRLDAATRTEWLLYGAPPPGTLLMVLGGMLVYGLLVVAAGLFDFYRRSV
jgi:hypothetical protein